MAVKTCARIVPIWVLHIQCVSGRSTHKLRDDEALDDFYKRILSEISKIFFFLYCTIKLSMKIANQPQSPFLTAQLFRFFYLSFYYYFFFFFFFCQKKIHTETITLFITMYHKPVDRVPIH